MTKWQFTRVVGLSLAISSAIVRRFWVPPDPKWKLCACGWRSVAHLVVLIEVDPAAIRFAAAALRARS